MTSAACMLVHLLLQRANSQLEQQTSLLIGLEDFTTQSEENQVDFVT